MYRPVETRRAAPRRLLLAGAAVSALVFAGTSMTRPFLPLLLEQWGASGAAVGAAAGLYALLPLLLAIPSGQWIDRVGPGRAALAGSLMVGAALIVVAVAPSSAAVTLSQLLAGQGQLLVVLATQVAAVTGASGRQLEQNVGALLATTAAVRMVGPAAGGAIVERWGTLQVFVAGGVASGLAFLPALLLELEGRRPALEVDATRTRGPRHTLAAWRRAGRWLRDDPVMRATVAVTVGVLLGESVRQVFLPLRQAGLSHGPQVVGLVWAAAGLGNLLARPLLSHLTAIAGGRWRLAVLTLVGTALSAGAVPLLVSPGAYTVVALVWGAASGAWPALATVVLAAQYRPEERALALGVRLMANQLAELAGPLLLGMAVSSWGLDAAFYLAAAGAGVLAATLRRPGR